MKAKGLRFIGRNKVIIDLSRHSDIMEDAIDRIKVKEAMENDEFVPWNEVKEILDKKHGIYDVQGDSSKKSAKVSRKRSKKRLSKT